MQRKNKRKRNYIRIDISLNLGFYEQPFIIDHFSNIRVGMTRDIVYVYASFCWVITFSSVLFAEENRDNIMFLFCHILPT